MSKEKKLIHENLLEVVADLMKGFSNLDEEAKILEILVLRSLCLVFEISEMRVDHLGDICRHLRATINFNLTVGEGSDEYSDMAIRVLESCIYRLKERKERMKKEEEEEPKGSS